MRFALLSLVFASQAVFAQTPLKAKMFPGAQALPVSAAVSQGFFARHGLASGEFHIAQSALDYAVAMVEVAKHDIVIYEGARRRLQ